MRGSVVKRGKKYCIVYDIPNVIPRKQKWVSGFDTRAEAEVALNKIMYDISSEVLACSYTVGSWLDYWIELHKSNISQNTLNGYLVNIRHIKSFAGNLPLSLLTPLYIQNMYSYLLESLSGTSVLYIHRVLKMSLQYAVNLEILPKNPCNSVTPPRKCKFNANVLTEEQLTYLLNSIKDTDLYIPVVLASLLGLRRGEIIGLNKSDLDITNKTLNISRSGKYKNGKLILSNTKTSSSCRTLLLSDSLVNLLSSVNTDRFTYLTDCQLNKKLSKTLEKLNLPHIRFHDLRHTYATLMLKSGIPSKIVSERLGHSSVQITLDTYSHILTSMQQPASIALDKYIK